MVTAYELYLRKQATGLAEGAAEGLLHMVGDVPEVAHVLHHGHQLLGSEHEPARRQR